MTDGKSYTLSFLGIGNYDETTYELGDRRHSTAYFVEALHAWFPERKVLLARTEAAWGKHGANLSLTFEAVPIAEGEDEAALWKMFEQIAAAIPANANLIIDVSHGLRSQPILALAACVYLQVVKGVTVERILYGAYEMRKNNISPVFDMTAFLDLIAWSNATDVFLRYGNAAPLRNLLAEIHEGTHREQRPYRAKGLKPLGTNLGELSRALALVRPQEALEVAARLPRTLEKATSDLAEMHQTAPFRHLLETITERYRPHIAAQAALFTKEGFAAQAAMIERYLENEQYQQAITLAREAVVSKLCVARDVDPIEERKVVTELLNAWAKKRNPEDPQEARLGELWQLLGDARNDINHAGMRKNALPAATAVTNIQAYCQRVCAFLRE